MITLDEVLEHSYRDFHAKGLHYISLPWPFTGPNKGKAGFQKFYFFEGTSANMGDVINPHNHRYMFSSTVLQGKLVDVRYIELHSYLSRIYNRFDYMTPLNGGNGFTEAGLIRLAMKEEKIVERGHALVSSPEDIHTIRVAADTVLSLIQYPDVLELNVPTQLYTLSDKAPSLDGLYKKWKEDELRAYLWKLRTLVALPVIE